MIIETIIIGGGALSIVFLNYWYTLYEKEKLKVINYRNQIPPNYNRDLEPSPQYILETHPPQYILETQPPEYVVENLTLCG